MPVQLQSFMHYKTAD